MTHSLHRAGCAESLKNDFVVLVLGGRKRLSESICRRISRRFPRFFKGCRGLYRKSGLRRLIMKGNAAAADHRHLRWAAVFHSKETFCAYLRELKDSKRGQSVVVSGLFDELDDCFRALDLRPHTVQFSLGYFGRTPFSVLR